jgi:hypothetical protein
MALNKRLPANYAAEPRVRLGASEADPSLSPAPPPIYAAACRWRSVIVPPHELSRLEAWAYPLTIGQPLPTMPLWLSEDLAVPLELEASYEETCRVLRIA